MDLIKLNFELLRRWGFTNKEASFIIYESKYHLFYNNKRKEIYIYGLTLNCPIAIKRKKDFINETKTMLKKKGVIA